jgi:hypothetical protein
MTAQLYTSSGSFILHGPSPELLLNNALEQATKLNCRGDVSGPCVACRQITAGTYPDLIIVRAEGRPSITIEQMRGVIAAQSLAPYHRTGRRIIIIDGAHQLTTEAQNALLKVLEEPPPSTVFLLLTVHPEALLPTVRSRCAGILVTDATSGMQEAPSIDLTSAPNVSLFERLLLAKKFSETKTDPTPSVTALHHAVTKAVRVGATDPVTGARQLGALELFRRQISAKVAPRVALERLMLEL